MIHYFHMTPMNTQPSPKTDQSPEQADPRIIEIIAEQRRVDAEVESQKMFIDNLNNDNTIEPGLKEQMVRREISTLQRILLEASDLVKRKSEILQETTSQDDASREREVAQPVSFEKVFENATLETLTSKEVTLTALLTRVRMTPLDPNNQDTSFDIGDSKATPRDEALGILEGRISYIKDRIQTRELEAKEADKKYKVKSA